MKKYTEIIYLNAIFFLYALANLFMKKASLQLFMSKSFILYAILGITLFGIYAIIWQQILKKIPLIVAFTNKGVIIIWSMIFGVIFFQEQIRWNMILGTIIILIGIFLCACEIDE